MLIKTNAFVVSPSIRYHGLEVLARVLKEEVFEVVLVINFTVERGLFPSYLV